MVFRLIFSQQQQQPSMLNYVSRNTCALNNNIIAGGRKTQKIGCWPLKSFITQQQALHFKLVFYTKHCSTSTKT